MRAPCIMRGTTTASTAVVAVISVFSLLTRVSFAGLRGGGSNGPDRAPGNMWFGAPRLRGSSGSSGDPVIAWARGGGNDPDGRAGLRGSGDDRWNETSRGVLPELYPQKVCVYLHIWHVRAAVPDPTVLYVLSTVVLTSRVLRTWLGDEHGAYWHHDDHAKGRMPTVPQHLHSQYDILDMCVYLEK